MQLPLSTRCKICVGIRVQRFIKRASKHIGFCAVLHVHFIGKSVYSPLSAKYTDIDLVLNYWSPCALYSAMQVAAVI